MDRLAKLQSKPPEEPKDIDDILEDDEVIRPQQGDTDVGLGTRINWRIHAALKKEAMRGSLEKSRYTSIKQILEEAILDFLGKVQAERKAKRRKRVA